MAAPKRTTPQAGLSPKFLDALRPRTKPFEVGDRGEHKGLRARISPHGAISFLWYVQHKGLRRTVTLGRYPETSLAEARDALKGWKVAHREGRLVAMLAERDEAAKPTPTGDPLTVRAFARDFLAHLDKVRRCPEQAHGMFKRDIIGTDDAPKPFADLHMAKVTKRDIRRVLEPIVDERKSPVAAGATLRLMRQFFAWAVDRDDDLPMPGFPQLATIRAKVAEESDRFLSAEEIGAFWQALKTSGMSPTIRGGLKLLLLLGVRSGELLKAEWSEIDFHEGKPDAERKPRWVIPPEHQKGHEKARPAKPFTVPLPPTAVAILRELKALADSIGSRFVLASFHLQETKPGKKVIGEAITEKALGAAMRKLFEGEPPVLKFEGERPTPHDLRRTVRFHVRNTLRVPFDVSEKLLGHSLGKIASTYDPGTLLDERREALLEWDAFVAALVAGKSELEAKAAAFSVREGAKVVPMQAKAVRS